MRKRLTAPSTALALLVCLSCGGDDSPSAPSTVPTNVATPGIPTAPSCRSYPSQYSWSAETTGAGPSSSVMATGSCSFSQADNSLRCQLTGSSFMTTIITSYATVADFVDEGQFLGRTLAQSRTQQSQNGSTTTTYRYDGQRRLTEWDTTGVASESATVMGWDVNGRLTVATDTVSTPLGTTTCSFTASYNDAARTASLSLSGCTTVRLEAQTFDETFFLTRLSISYPQEGIEALFSWDVIDRFQVCK